MQILSLRIENFGLFQGIHHLDLVSPHDTDTQRNLTVFVGHNGAGKSTLFQAISLALHGLLALGDRTTDVQYNDFLYSRMHRLKGEAKDSISDEASAALSLAYVQSGVPRRVHISRCWRRSGRIVSEALEVLQDGQLLATEAADAQAWINELLPPGIARLCFFDAENLDALAGADQCNPALGEALQRLLGLDIIHRLQADLRAYTLKQGGNSAVENWRLTVLAHQASLEVIDRKLAALQEQSTELAEEEITEKKRLTEQEHRLHAAGGLYAARRTTQQERLTHIQAESQTVQDQLADLSAHLLPFALAPALCRRLSERLTQEADLQRQQVAQELVQERFAEVESAVSTADFWQNLHIEAEQQQALVQQLQSVLRAHTPTSDHADSLRHPLADPERHQLQGWIHQALEVVPGQSAEIGNKLRALQQEQQALELDLQRAPDDAALAPLHAELIEIQVALADIQRHRAQLQESIGAEQYKRAEKDRQMQRAVEDLMKAQASETEVVLAERSRSVLRTFEDALTRQRISDLEQALVKCFNELCQKEHLLEAVTIAPKDFAVTLESAHGRMLRLSSFSAGERQLYAMALLQAMRQVSGRELPLLVDTPLARLDEAHRQRLLQNYLPIVSDQVLLFATDAEANAEFFTQAEPYLAQAYRLRFDPIHGVTQPMEIKSVDGLMLEMNRSEETSYAL
jgi:DNA sulfur modification protein DndD